YHMRANLKEAYDTKGQCVVKEFEKRILLHNIDEAWKENLRELDDLKQSVQNASYEQKDPLLIFKLESAEIFKKMVNRINDSAVATLMRAQIPQQAADSAPTNAPAEQPRRRPQYTESHGGDQLSDTQKQMQQAAQNMGQQRPTTPIVKEKLPGRNDPCPCGSGKKFKQCHGKGLV
ncbi:MAG: SEC-C domain-containing protein, partial [Bacteroidaceae bacterium]|nr:SEC-C domain-containing protein [Bacteroidaceae bacterium]